MNKEILYQSSLEALEELFVLVGEEYWGQWIRKHMGDGVKLLRHHSESY